MTHDLEYYLAAASDMMTRASRTVETGRIDTSYSGAKDKPKGIIHDPELMRTTAQSNIADAVAVLYERRDAVLTPLEFRALFETIAAKVRADTIDKSSPLYRSHEIESKKSYYGCKVAEIMPAMERFYSWAADVFKDQMAREDISRYGAQIEKIIDTDIHPLADACGRVGKLLSIFLSMRNDASVKLFPLRDVYYKAMGAKRDVDSIFDEESAREIIELYKSRPDFVLVR